MGVPKVLILTSGAVCLISILAVRIWPALFYLLASLLALLSFFCYKKQQFWAKRGVPTLPYKPIIGHSDKLFSKETPRYAFVHESYCKYKSSKMSGFYEFIKPTLMISDVDILRHILIKDFDHFTDRRSFDLRGTKEEWVGNLLTLAMGKGWKKIRSIISPTFSTSKMRGMYEIILRKSNVLLSSFREKSRHDEDIDVKEYLSAYTMDVIASCAFGLESESPEEQLEFSRKAEGIMPIMRISRAMLYSVFPWLFRVFGLRFSKPEVDYFIDVAHEVVRERKKCSAQRGDFLDLLLQAHRESEESSGDESSSKVCEETIIAQSLLFLLAGYDTTSLTLTFALHLLGQHKDYQRILREEVQMMPKEDEEFPYEVIMQEKQIESFINETLRLYPVAPFFERKCVKPYKVPGTSLTLPKDMIVTIPAWSLHRDETFWEKPLQFDPTRFLPENKHKIESMAFVPFGEGPRNCIGKRFAMMELKVVLAKILDCFEVELKSDPNIRLDPTPGVLRPLGDVIVKLTAIHQ